jgi:hypothetical protein
MFPNDPKNGANPTILPPNHPPKEEIVGSLSSLVEGSGLYWSFALVEERMVEAVGFLDRVSKGGRNPYATDGPWALVIRDRNAGAQVDGEVADWIDSDIDGAAKARGGLRAAEVDRMEQSLEWITLVQDRKGRLRPLVGTVLHEKQRGGQVQWAEVRRRLRSSDSHDVLRKSYSRAIAAIADKLNRKRVPVS